jgi:hypothetical protein
MKRKYCCKQARLVLILAISAYYRIEEANEEERLLSQARLVLILAISAYYRIEKANAEERLLS